MDTIKDHKTYKAQYQPLGPYSFSQLSLFEECPRKYWLQYVAALEEEDKIALEIGSALHSAVERGMLFLCDTKPDHLNIIEWFAHANSDAPTNPQVKEPYRRCMNSFMEWMTTDRWKDWISEEAEVATEFSFGLGENWEPLPWSGERDDKPEGMLFRGSIDLLTVYHHRFYGSVIDLKSGKNRYEVLKNNLPAKQLVTYSFAVFQIYPHLHFLHNTFFNLMLSNETEPPIVIDRLSAEKYGRDWISKCVKGIRKKDWKDVDNWEPKTNDNCIFCSFKDTCPLYQQSIKDGNAPVRKYRFNEFAFLEATRAMAMDDDD